METTEENSFNSDKIDTETAKIENLDSKDSNIQIDNSIDKESNESNNQAWIGALKKKARDKGKEEGYQLAKQELEEALKLSQVDQSDNQEPEPHSQSYDVQKIADQVKQQHLHQHYQNISQRGSVKYSDYNEKVKDYLESANKNAESNNPDMMVLMKMAADQGDEDLVYKIASDSDFCKSILESNPRSWTNKLLKNQINFRNGNSFSNSRSEPPIKDLPKSSPHENADRQLTQAEKRLRAKKLFS